MNKSRIKRNYQEPAIPFTLKAPFKPMGDQPKAIHTPIAFLLPDLKSATAFGFSAIASSTMASSAPVSLI